MGVCDCSMFCCTLLYVLSSIAIILMGKRELIALLKFVFLVQVSMIRKYHKHTPQTNPKHIQAFFSVLLLWIIFVISVLFLLCFHALLFIDALWSPAGKGLTSWLSFVMSNSVKLSLSHWYPGSGVVLDCIDS